MQCVRAHYRDEATMCCFPTNLTFCLYRAKRTLQDFFVHMLIDSLTLRQKFIMYHASDIKKCYQHQLDFGL